MKDFIRKKYKNLPLDFMASLDSFSSRYGDVINLALGDLNVTTDAQVIKKSYEDALNGHTHYTSVAGDPQLVKMLIDYLYEHCGITYTPKNILITTSGSHALYLSMAATIEAGDEVIVLEPYFPPFAKMIESAGGTMRLSACLSEDNFLPSKEALNKVTNSKTKCIIINSPNNPTGRIYQESLMREIFQFSEQRDIFIISDEVYGSFDFTGDFITQAKIDPHLRRSVVVNSFSKTFAMTGWRLGFALGPPELIEAMKSVNEGIISSPPSISQRAGIYALEDKERILSELTDLTCRRLKVALEEVNKTPKMSVLKPEGGIYLFISIKESGLSSLEAQKLIFEEVHVLFYPGSMFGNSGEGYLRMAVSQPEEQIREAFNRIRRLDAFS